MHSLIRRLLLVTCASAVATVPLRAWDYEGHRMVNQLALASLPKDYPVFVQAVANLERVTFLAGEPDRWRNVPDLPFKHAGPSWGDHFLDVEQLPEAGIDPAKVTSFRYDFVVQFAAGRAAHPEHFPAVDPARNADHTREWPGFAPWAIAENFAKLRSAFSYLKVFEELGTPDEIMNAQANVLYTMGVLGHYLGDCAQPLHTTKHHDGWVGENPQHYSTARGLHSWVDGTFIARAGIRPATLLPRIKVAEPIAMAPRSDGRDPVFVAAMDYIIASNGQVERIYQLVRDNKFGQTDGVITDEARSFMESRILEGARMVSAFWVTAYRSAVPDTYLRSVLIKRQTAANGEAPRPKSNP